MNTRAVRIYGKNDLRLEEFELPPMKEGEILAKVVSDSICMSSHKATLQGAEHKRIPDNVAENPTIIGHEFSGELIEVGKKWSEKFKPGQKFSIQPALNYRGSLDAPGYSYPYIGGNATHILIPEEVMAMDCLLPYDGPGYFPASLAEPISCVIGAFNANYHTAPGSYVHRMGIVEGGTLAILAGAGPMGLAAINYVLNRSAKPKLLLVTDVDDQRLQRAESLYSAERAKEKGIDLKYINPRNLNDPVKDLRAFTGGKGYSDVFVFAPVSEVVEQGDRLLARSGCLNFFAGPEDSRFTAKINFYNVHYESTHIVGTSGGNNHDMLTALSMMAEGLDPAGLVTHIGGLNAVIDTTKRLPGIAGGKKLIYTHLHLDLIAIEDFEQYGKTNSLFRELANITGKHNGLWSVEAEEYLLNHGPGFSQ
jgi:threonine dehydrogenase-like Zn-dependent dehydrogenase